MARRQRRLNGAADTAESRYAKGKAAEWLLNVMESGIHIDSSFLECAEWILSGLRSIVIHIDSKLKTITQKGKLSYARKEIQNLLLKSERRIQIHDEIDDFMGNHPRSDKMVEEAVRNECIAAAKFLKADGAVYRRARQRLRRIFGLDENACAVCEFLFIKDAFQPVENYFEDHLALNKFENRKKFSDMFRMEPTALQECLFDLVSWGICEEGCLNYSLTDGLDLFWKKSSSAQVENLFCRALQGKMKTLPLEKFNLPVGEVAHVRALLESKGDAPVHILLYGEPGTGKTAFAQSLAQTLKLKAWVVPCSDENHRGGDDNDCRRAGLSACLNMAAKHKGAFVLLDEAERFLDTGDRFGWHTKDKAWLNDFLEKPGRRVIWIVNDIYHVHPSVRRRFTFSVYFKPLGCDERRQIWKSVLEEQRAVNCLPEEQIKNFACDYPVSPAVVKSAVRQAKILARRSPGKAVFAETAERVLRSHVILERDGESPRPKSQLSGEYSPEGVCLEGSVDELLDKCRRINAMMREGKTIRSGGATMLFYGPPGSGKSALAKYLADKLERELVLRRASDLLDPYVGMSERNVAAAFREAERAILVIDEVDSFLYSRNNTIRSWENTLVNEFLTSLEECRGFCVCTTNRMKDLDEAAMRRFSFKISFGFAGPEQAKALYKSLLAPLVDGELPEKVEVELSRLHYLAPGDFHTVKSRYWLAERGEVTHNQLLENLVLEEKLKRDGQAHKIGF